MDDSSRKWTANVWIEENNTPNEVYEVELYTHIMRNVAEGRIDNISVVHVRDREGEREFKIEGDRPYEGFEKDLQEFFETSDIVHSWEFDFNPGR